MAKIKYDTCHARVIYKDEDDREIIRCPRCTVVFGLTLDEARKADTFNEKSWYQLAGYGHHDYKKHLQRNECNVDIVHGQDVPVEELIRATKSESKKRSRDSTMSSVSRNKKTHCQNKPIFPFFFDLLEFLQTCPESPGVVSPSETSSSISGSDADSPFALQLQSAGSVTDSDCS